MIKRNNKGQFIKGFYQGFGFQKGHPKPINAYKFGRGENHYLWKGDFASYQSMHHWVVKYKGKANHCMECGSISAKKYEWSNIDHEYRRVLKDYVSRCTSCHRNYDLRMGFIALNAINSKGQFIKIKELI